MQIFYSEICIEYKGGSVENGINRKYKIFRSITIKCLLKISRIGGNLTSDHTLWVLV